MSGGSTTIQYTLSTDATITIIIYDITGHEVKRMKFRSGTAGGKGGTNQVNWNGISLGGEVVGNGMYLYKIISGDKVIGSGKLVIFDR
jgi:flagellar hook assembly protein FlgD